MTYLTSGKINTMPPLRTNQPSTVAVLAIVAVLLSCTIGMMLNPLSANAFNWRKPMSLFYTDDPSTTAIATPAVETPAKQTQQGVLLETERGTIGFTLFAKDAPITVANFEKLVAQGFYNVPTMTFHRVVPGFVVQMGDPTGTGMGGSDAKIPLEVKNKLTHGRKGMVAMARSADPDSASSQFYITLAPQSSLDGKYAVFGEVVSGLDVLDKIEQGDRVLGVKLVDPATLVANKPATKSGASVPEALKHLFKK
jgi:peptidyl-prolyl cis-trans isomerase B (cyclophilin B)